MDSFFEHPFFTRGSEKARSARAGFCWSIFFAVVSVFTNLDLVSLTRTCLWVALHFRLCSSTFRASRSPLQISAHPVESLICGGVYLICIMTLILISLLD